MKKAKILEYTYKLNNSTLVKNYHNNSLKVYNNKKESRMIVDKKSQEILK